MEAQVTGGLLAMEEPMELEVEVEVVEMLDLGVREEMEVMVRTD